MPVPSLTRRGFLLGCAMTLAGCSATTPMPRSHPTSAYAGEPYAVRPVDRSKFSAAYQPTELSMSLGLPPGSIFVDTSARQLFFIESVSRVRRYGVAVGASGLAWKGTARVERKSTWPAWHPTDDMHAQTPGLPHRIDPGPANPLGARALYLFQGGRDTLYRIHGTSEPWTIGTEASSGCIRMLNEDVIDLYDRVSVGARVIVG